MKLTYTTTCHSDIQALTRIANIYTYRYKLPVPFGGRLVSKRHTGKKVRGEGGWDTKRKSSRQVKGQNFLLLDRRWV